MSKAEEQAYNAYPLTEKNRLNHENNAKRLGFSQGYHQAEEDLALTWKDIEAIFDIHRDLEWEDNISIDTEEWYKEILRRFNEERSKT